jgi:DNA-binding NarL/FixJ family response regulator
MTGKSAGMTRGGAGVTEKAEGKSSRTIAGRLHVSVRTVDTHRKHIMDKLGFRSIAESRSTQSGKG